MVIGQIIYLSFSKQADQFSSVPVGSHSHQICRPVEAQQGCVVVAPQGGDK